MIADFAAVCAVVIWLYLVLGRGMFWRVRGLKLEPAPPSGGRVAVIIPARNEAETVGASVASLAAQDHAGPLHIFLVDDQSQDSTAETARAAPRSGPANRIL